MKDYASLTQDEWVVEAALCELIAMGLRLPTQELAEAVASGEFAEALVEVGTQAGIDKQTLSQAKTLLADYSGQDPEVLFHTLRIEYTRLFVGAPEPEVSPFAGVWHAREQGVQALLFVNPRSMEIERFMRSCGIGQADGKNEPLDNISTMFEFLQYLALANAGAVEKTEGIEIPDDAFKTFYSKYVANWAGAGGFADSVIASARIPFYKAMAEVIKAILASWE